MSYDNPNLEHPTRSKSFEQRFVDAINDAGLMLMCSIGHRTGLFDTMAGMDWATSEEIAASAGLNERYVREWLGAVTTGQIVEGDLEDRFRLPSEHASFLSRDGTNENLAVIAQYVSVLGSVEDDIVDCFREGGGVPYERYDRFHEVMAEDSGMTVLAALEDYILPLVPGLVERLEHGSDVLDVGCGRGRALMALAERFPNSSFHGFDLSPEAVAWAEEQVQERELTNLHLEVRDASDFDRTAAPDTYDLVMTFDAIHDQAQPLAVLKGIAKTLKPDGIYLMQDIHSSSHVHGDMDHPLGPFLYTISCMHCMSVSLAQNGEGLGAMWGRETAMEYLQKAGFTDIQVHQLEHDVQNDYFVARQA